jgi:hypothetical protein
MSLGSPVAASARSKQIASVITGRQARIIYNEWANEMNVHVQAPEEETKEEGEQEETKEEEEQDETKEGGGSTQ